jgi:transmembrane sensor
MDSPDYNKIIFNYFRGRLKGSEYEVLTVYLQNQSNRDNFERKKKEWVTNPELDETGRKNWDILQSEINKQESYEFNPPVKHGLKNQLASYAAILILGLFCGGFLIHIISVNKLKHNQLVFETTRGAKSHVLLPDGSEAWLNSSSRLVYHSFTSRLRQVELKGEAFFKVAHNEKAPFSVRTNECNVKVLGTTFNVMAYEEFGRNEITLLNGKVNVFTENSQHVLKPGQTLIIKDKTVKLIEKNTSQVSGWIDNKLNFQNIPLSELIIRLENWYDIDIALDNQTGREANFTGTFKNEETIWQVLDAIKVYMPIQYEKAELRKIRITVK